MKYLGRPHADWGTRLAALCIAACTAWVPGSTKADDFENLLRSRDEFRNAIAVSFGEDDEALYKDVSSGGQRNWATFTWTGCNGIPHLAANIENFTGQLKPTWKQDNPSLDGPHALLWAWAAVNLNVLNINFAGRTERHVCVLYNSTPSRLQDELTKEAQNNNVAIASPSLKSAKITVPLAYRTNVVVTFKNEYQADIPLKGNSKIKALVCEYDLSFLGGLNVSGMPRLQSSGKGSCQGKWFLDNDTGRWALMSFATKDPDILVSWPEPKKSEMPADAHVLTTQELRNLLVGKTLRTDKAESCTMTFLPDEEVHFSGNNLQCSKISGRWTLKNNEFCVAADFGKGPGETCSGLAEKNGEFVATSSGFKVTLSTP